MPSVVRSIRVSPSCAGEIRQPAHEHDADRLPAGVAFDEELLDEEQARKLEAGPQHGEAGKAHGAAVAIGQGVARAFRLPHGALDHRTRRLERLCDLRADIMQVQGTNQSRDVGHVLRGGEADGDLGHAGALTV